MSLITSMEGRLRLHKTHPRVAKFDYASILKDAKEKLDALVSFKAVSDGWVPGLDIEQASLQLDTVIADFRSAVASLHKYNKVFLGIELSTRRMGIQKKRKWTNHRDTMARKLRESALPTGISKVAADHLQALADAPEDAGVHSPIAVPELQFEERFSVEKFDGPVLISRLADLDGALTPTYYHEHLATVFEKNQSIIEQKSPMVVKELVGGRVSCSMVVSNGHLAQWRSDNGTCGNWIENKTCKLVLVAQKTLKFDSRIEVFPWRGVRVLLTVATGRLIVICVAAAQAAEHDVHAWLKKCDGRALASNRAAVLDSGDSLMLPFGMVPIIVGLPSDDACLTASIAGRPRVPKGIKLNTDEVVTYTLNFVFDSALDATASTDVKSFVASSWVKATPHLHASFREAEVIKAWSAAISAVPPAAGTESGGDPGIEATN